MNNITNEFVMEKLAWGAKRPTPIRELMEAPQMDMSDKDTPPFKPGANPRMTDQRNLNPPAPRVQMSGVRPTLNQSRMDQDVQDFGSKLTSGGLGQRISESHGQAINAVMDKERADGEYGRNKNKITTGTTRGVVGSKGGTVEQPPAQGSGIRGVFGQVGNALKSGVNAVTQEQVDAELAKRKPNAPTAQNGPSPQFPLMNQVSGWKNRASGSGSEPWYEKGTDYINPLESISAPGSHLPMYDPRKWALGVGGLAGNLIENTGRLGYNAAAGGAKFFKPMVTR